VAVGYSALSRIKIRHQLRPGDAGNWTRKAPDVEIAGAVLGQSLNIVGVHVVLEAPGRQPSPGIAREAVLGADQQAAVLRDQQCVDDVVGEPLTGGASDKIVALKTADPAAACGNPETAGVVLDDIHDKMGAQAGVTAFIEKPEVDAVEAHQSLLGADPDKAARILKDLLDRIHRQAVFGGIEADIVLRDQFVGIESSGGCENEQQQAEEQFDDSLRGRKTAQTETTGFNNAVAPCFGLVRRAHNPSSAWQEERSSRPE